MTMMDEQALRDALKVEADEFVVSEDAIRHLLEEASVGEPEPHVPRGRIFVPRSRGVRVLALSVAALILASAIAVPLMRTETPAPTPGAASALTPAGSHELTVTASGAQATISTNSKKLTATGFTVAPKIESNGFVSLTVRVGKVPSAIKQLISLVERDRGYVESSQAQVGSHTAGSFATGTVVLEVPQRTFPRLVSQVQSVGHATSVNTTSNNVTTQYVNLQSRIAALNVSLHQYFTIMARATTISAILAVQSQINTIQSEIQQDQGQLNVLNHETTYSALSVNLSSGAQHSTSGPRTGFNKAWHDSVSGFIAGFQWLLRLAGPLLFALLMLAVLYGLFRVGRRASLRRKLQ
jgi:hypothetical protein